MLFSRLARPAPGAATIPELRRDHERFGVDLDRFERQVTSYELSGDPTVLVNLGNRMIREFRKHLEAEEQLLAKEDGCGSLGST